jgi:hypothetical protein
MATDATGERPRLADVARHQRLPEHELLNSLIGKWITGGVLSDDGRAMPTRHEWSDDGVTWRPSMDVTLWKVV